jgi:hypothetical protein
VKIRPNQIWIDRESPQLALRIVSWSESTGGWAVLFGRMRSGAFEAAFDSNTVLPEKTLRALYELGWPHAVESAA